MLNIVIVPFGGIFRGLAKVEATSSTDDHTASLRLALICTVFSVHSLSSDKERTKKTDQRLPPLETAFVPRYKEHQEIDKSLVCAVLQGSHHERQAEEAR